MVHKYNKTNGVTPMKTHVDFTHFQLVMKRKLILIKKFIAKNVDFDHSHQPRKKRMKPFGSIIIAFF
jgi:hypothetical protein